MKLSVVIPVWNEKDTVEKIINKVNKVPLDKEIVVVDDGSTDGTVEKLKAQNSKLKNKDLKIIYKEKNEGKGSAVREGFKYVTGDYVIIQDADLEYYPQEYLKLIKALEEEKADVVYGSRFKGEIKKIMKSHYFGNRMLTTLFNLLYRTSLTDMETCYKLFPGDFVRKVRIKSKGFGFEPEVTAKLLREGLKIVEVPITYKGRTFEEGKKISWKHGLRTILAILRFRFFS